MRTMLARLVAVALAALPVCATLAHAEPAEPPISNPNDVVTSVTEEGLTALLQELGATKFESRELGDGRKQIVFYDGTMPYNVSLTGCNIRPGKCIAFSLIALLDTGTTNFPLESLNAVNQNNLFVTMVKVENGKYGGGRIELIDGGVTRKNLAITIASFIVNFKDEMGQLQKQLVASNPGNAYLGAYLGAGPGTAQLRLVPATPKQMLQLVDGLTRHHATTLRH